MMKEAWEKAWDETPWELRRRVQRWGPSPINPETKKTKWACRLKGERNQCPTCGDFFSGLESFDAHRTGLDGKTQKGKRRAEGPGRCLTLAEMRENGFVRNEYFYWTAKRAK